MYMDTILGYCQTSYGNADSLRAKPGVGAFLSPARYPLDIQNPRFCV